MASLAINSVGLTAKTNSTQTNAAYEHRPIRVFLVIQLLLIFYYEICALLDVETFVEIANRVGPITMFCSCIWLTIQLAKLNPLLLWSPLPWLLFSSACYFGIGPLASVWGTAETQAHLQRFVVLDPATLLRLNHINSVSTLLTILAFSFGRSVFTSKSPRVNRVADLTGVAEAKIAAIWFVLVGMSIVFFVALPYEFGVTKYLLPGSLYALALLPMLALIVLAFLSIRCAGPWRRFFWATVGANSLIALLRFSKTDLILVVLLSTLGAFLATARLRTLTKGATILVVIYVVLCPFVSWCRSRMANDSGDIQQYTLGQRWTLANEAIATYLDQGTLRDNAEVQDWWLRLSYANAQTLALQEYDRGRPGSSLWQAPYALIPRVIWPNKPDMTLIGVDFNELANGHRGSSMGIGTYAEAYWNGGWAMVLVVCVGVGMLFAWITRDSLERIASRQWLHLVGIFIGVRMGTRVDGWIVPDFIGGFVIYLAYGILIRLVYRRRRSYSPAVSQLNSSHIVPLIS